MVVAGLTDSGSGGRWAEALLAGDSLAAPHLMPVEAGNILRRAALAGDISADVASLAHTDLLDLRGAGMGAPGERDLLRRMVRRRRRAARCPARDTRRPPGELTWASLPVPAPASRGMNRHASAHDRRSRAGHRSAPTAADARVRAKRGE